MKRQLADYRMIPRVVQSGVETLITIQPRGYHANFDDNKTYELSFVPMEHSNRHLIDQDYERISVVPQNGAIVFRHTFEGEQLQLVRVLLDNVQQQDFYLYSLEEDLYKKRPYKGDLHAHSCHSDGWEEPAVVVANYRKWGYDFFALTDHEQYAPSVETIEKYKDVPTDMALFYGEEVHIPTDYIHAINFGGSYSVNELFRQNRESCLAEIAELEKTLTVPDGVDSLDIARRCWIAKKIQETGGLSIFVHPHWVENAFHVPDAVSDYLFEHKVYEAFELLGGQSVFENNMQTALYTEQRAKGREIPVVGSDDSHGSEDADWFRWSYTIVFSEDLKLDSIKNAVKNYYSAAISNYPNEHQRAFGPYRMVKYALFLLEEYFPVYDELCFEQGRAMKDYVLGDKYALDVLKVLKGRTDRFACEFFGKSE